MKAVILAAGEGTRLKPYTNDRPKCMVPVRDKPIIEYILESLDPFEFQKTIVVSGYRNDRLEEKLKGRKISFFHNARFDSTNMVYSLFCAEPEFDDDLVISYSDIIFKKEIVEKLMASVSDVSVVVDSEWQKLWELRMEEPLEDAETMKLDSDGNILELGKKPKSLDEIQGQYVGLIKISKQFIPRISKFYHSLSKSVLYDGKNFDNMYMTSFIQLIIDRLAPVKAVSIAGGWVEVDNTQDLEIYEEHPELFSA